jgi:hypothetical protein
MRRWRDENGKTNQVLVLGGNQLLDAINGLRGRAGEQVAFVRRGKAYIENPLSCRGLLIIEGLKGFIE